MGMTRAKSLIEAREGLTFLDVIVRQTLALRARHGIRLPLVLMNSYRTRADTLAALERYPDLAVDVPLDFLQHREPRIRADDLAPVEWPADPELEWCPPGHGDLYPALRSSGTLDALLERGYRYAFVSNADNLGAVLDPDLLAWFAAEEAPFAMEVVVGTELDRKGGHIARRRENGRLVLRETAQADDPESFRDFRRWRYYNSNNLWMDLRAMAALLDAGDGVIELPLIVNRKPVDAGDRSSPEVIQLESAMGAAIGAFEGARAVCVPRTRFAPVKTTDDLLVLRSDVYRLDEDARVQRDGDEPFVALDPAHFKTIADFDARFPAGPPSLAGAERLVVGGDVTFGAGVVARGSVEIEAQEGEALRVPDGAALG
jgi:UTP--glucose-1-phosphate uridylyltransferase